MISKCDQCASLLQHTESCDSADIVCDQCSNDSSLEHHYDDVDKMLLEYETIGG